MPPSDVVVFGGELTRRNLVNAYRKGIFPWPFAEDAPIPWCSPDPRSILRFSKLHVPRSLAKILRRHPYRLSIDEDFDQVIRSCAEMPRPHENSTWIYRYMIDAYQDLHQAGYAHSVEVWEGDNLVGGLYGVSVDGVFAGESMFHRQSNTSKIALMHLVKTLQLRGLDWIDIQMRTPLFEQFGAEELPREMFLELMQSTQVRGLDLW